MTYPKQELRLIFMWITWLLYDCNSCCKAKEIRKPFISKWYDIAANGTSPLVISHTLNEIPVKVDVQVKIVKDGKNYIFPGLGSAPRDNDIPAEYGGVAYTYNSTHVLLFVPVYKTGGSSEGIGRVVTTGSTSYDGPFIGSMSVCKVRVRAWRLSDWPKPDFSVKDGLTISKTNAYKKIQHWLGSYSDFVTVQLYSSRGLVFEGLGTTSITVDHVDPYKYASVCGTVFGIDDTSITLWAASKFYDYVACFRDGWGNSYTIEVESADVIIHAWVLKQTDILYENKFAFVKGDTLSGKIPVVNTLDLDYHLVNVEVKDDTIPHGKVFYGAGSANLGNPGEPFGGVVFGYTESEVVLWTPSPHVSSGNMIYIGGLWGDGTEDMEINRVQISVRVIIAGFSDCKVPPGISNTEMLYDGIINGSKVLYSCSPGFSSNGGKLTTMCNGTMWSATNLTCSSMCISLTTEIQTTTTTQQSLSSPAGTTISHESINVNLEEFQRIVDGLKVGRNNTSAYRRRITCAYDPRKSSMAIGSLGALFISGVIGLIVLADCLTIMKTWD